MDRHAAQPRGKITPVLWNTAEQDPPRNVRRPIQRGGEGAVVKARYQQVRRISGASPSEQLSHQRTRRGFSSACGFELDIRAETKFGEEHQSLFQRWHTLPGEGRMKPSARVMASDGGERQRAYPAAPVGRALQPVVVKQNRLVVGSEPDIELDPAAAERLCLAQSGESVLRGTGGGAAMADDRRQDSFDLSAHPGDSGPPGVECRQFATFACGSWRSGLREPRSLPVSWSTWRMLSLTFPRSSKPSTLTLTLSPSLTTSATLPTRCGASSLM